MAKKFPWDDSIKQGYFYMEDVTCCVVCECDNADIDESLFISDHEIVRCPYCGRGYKTEFVVWQYAPDEED